MKIPKIVLTFMFVLNPYMLYSADQVCWKSYRTTFNNNSGLPLELTIVDNVPKNNTTQISIPKGENKVFDLPPNFSIKQVTAETINNKGVPIKANLDMATLKSATRTIKIKEEKDQLILETELTKEEKVQKAQPISAVSVPTVSEGQKPKKANERVAGEKEILIHNKAEIPAVAYITDSTGKKHQVSIPGGKKSALYLAAPACFKAIDAETVVRQTGERIRVSLAATVPCEDQVIEINDRNNHKELVVELIRGKGLPSLTATSKSVTEIQAEEEKKPEVVGQYNVALLNKTIYTIVLKLKYTVNNKSAEVIYTLRKNDSKTVQTGCITEIAVATTYKEKPIAIASYTTPLECADYSIKITEERHQRVAIEIGKEKGKEKRVTISPPLKELKELAAEMQAGEAARLAAAEITKELLVYRIKNEGPLDPLSVKLTDEQGKVTSLDLKKGVPQTPTVGCIFKIEASGINKRAQEIKETFQGKLVCTDHELTFSGDQDTLIIKLDGKKIAPVGEKKAAKIAKGPTNKLKLENKASFSISVKITETDETMHVKTLATKATETIETACIKKIEVESVDKTPKIQVGYVSLLDCDKGHTLVVKVSDQGTRLDLDLNGQPVASSERVQTQISVKNEAGFVISITLNDQKPVTIAKGQKTTITMGCLKKIVAEGTNKFGQKLMVQTSQPISCEKDQTVIVKDKNDQTQLGIWIEGIGQLVLSAPITKEEKKEIKKELTKEEKEQIKAEEKRREEEAKRKAKEEEERRKEEERKRKEAEKAAQEKAKLQAKIADLEKQKTNKTANIDKDIQKLNVTLQEKIAKGKKSDAEGIRKDIAKKEEKKRQETASIQREIDKLTADIKKLG